MSEKKLNHDYREPVLSIKENEALVVFGEAGEGKNTAIRSGLGVVLPSRILDIEQVIEITYDPHKED
ncbi:TPA: hypothetical protein ACJG25_004133 [Salmonella enterica subsp. enterica serovar Saintpaul]